MVLYSNEMVIQKIESSYSTFMIYSFSRKDWAHIWAWQSNGMKRLRFDPILYDLILDDVHSHQGVYVVMCSQPIKMLSPLRL